MQDVSGPILCTLSDPLIKAHLKECMLSNTYEIQNINTNLKDNLTMFILVQKNI